MDDATLPLVYSTFASALLVLVACTSSPQSPEPIITTTPNLPPVTLCVVAADCRIVGDTCINGICVPPSIAVAIPDSGVIIDCITPCGADEVCSAGNCVPGPVTTPPPPPPPPPELFCPVCPSSSVCNPITALCEPAEILTPLF